MYFNEFVNNKRKELNMSIDDLAKKSGIPKSTLGKITAGINTNPTLSTAEAICSALGCMLNDAVGYEDRKNKKSPTSREDKRKERLLKNYDAMNETGKDLLTAQSDYMVSKAEFLKIC